MQGVLAQTLYRYTEHTQCVKSLLNRSIIATVRSDVTRVYVHCALRNTTQTRVLIFIFRVQFYLYQARARFSRVHNKYGFARIKCRIMYIIL